jgi:hypothetical protein
MNRYSHPSGGKREESRIVAAINKLLQHIFNFIIKTASTISLDDLDLDLDQQLVIRRNAFPPKGTRNHELVVVIISRMVTVIIQ